MRKSQQVVLLGFFKQTPYIVLMSTDQWRPMSVILVAQDAYRCSSMLHIGKGPI